MNRLMQAIKDWTCVGTSIEFSTDALVLGSDIELTIETSGRTHHIVGAVCSVDARGFTMRNEHGTPLTVHAHGTYGVPMIGEYEGSDYEVTSIIAGTAVVWN